MDTVPKGLRSLRACLGCSLIKTIDQFELDGCENCNLFLRIKNDRDAVMRCTSGNFDGMIAVMCPEDSWVSKWQRISKFTKGVYALSVSGTLPREAIKDMRSQGITYRNRDTSQR
ncbi:transcription elongation factor SPT4 [Leptopilina heterotoma]|uniref:transcription elongation factor SPT4 n=1 Tax=Leptopilina heterotoma TaxID=63436 RepID=UPI001CA82478|nr:transcription elongation factor SPT4 [Leptopilina heterotoma]